MKETKNVFMSELTEVFNKRQQQFIQFACSYVRDREEAEDIVMGAFTNVWEHRNELQKKETKPPEVIVHEPTGWQWFWIHTGRIAVALCCLIVVGTMIKRRLNPIHL